MSLGAVSETRLATCHPDLQRLVHAVADGVDRGDLAAWGVRDVTVLEGHRGEAAQNAAYDAGFSRLRWPNSAHNSLPARAVDLAPYPVDWAGSAKPRFDALQHYVRGVAAGLGVRLRPVLAWDAPHYELARAPAP